MFADAGYWIALFNPRDQLHAKAISVSTTLQGRSIVTSQMVLTEFLNHYAALGQPFRQRAVQVVRSLQDNVDVEVVPQTEMRSLLRRSRCMHSVQTKSGDNRLRVFSHHARAGHYRSVGIRRPFLPSEFHSA